MVGVRVSVSDSWKTEIFTQIRPLALQDFKDQMMLFFSVFV